MLCEHSCKINNLRPCRSTRGCLLWLLSLKCSVGFLMSENTFIDLSPVITIPKLRRISWRIVRNRLCVHCVHLHRPCFPISLLPFQCRAQLQWSQNNQRCRIVQWEVVLFTDVLCFHLDGSDGLQRVYRRRTPRTPHTGCALSKVVNWST